MTFSSSLKVYVRTLELAELRAEILNVRMDKIVAHASDKGSDHKIQKMDSCDKPSDMINMVDKHGIALDGRPGMQTERTA